MAHALRRAASRPFPAAVLPPAPAVPVLGSAAARSSIALTVAVNGHFDLADGAGQHQFIQNHAHPSSWFPPHFRALRASHAFIDGTDMPILAAHPEFMARLVVLRARR